MLAGILFAAAIAAPLVSRRLAGDPASPPAVVIAAWGGTLGLFALHRLPYIPLDTRTWTVIAASVLVTVAAQLAGMRAAGTARRPAVGGRTLERARAWIPAYALAGLVGVVWYAWNVATTLGWEAFREGPRIREALATYQIPSAFLFLQFFCIATPLLSAAVWLSGLRLRRIDVVLTALCVAGTWLSTDRTEFFTVVLGSLFMVLYARGPAWSVARTAGIGSIVLGGLAVNFLAINLWMRKQPEASAYVYLTASYPALQHALASPPAFTHGLHSVYPIARLLERLHLVRGPLPSPIFPFVPVTAGMPDHEWTFNGYTWLNYAYQDWGLGGVFAYVAVVGAAGGVLYGLLRRNRSRPIVLLLTAEMATGFLLSPFVDKFNNTASWYVAVATSVPFLAASRRRRARE